MVFENLTLIEVHLEGVEVGPNDIGPGSTAQSGESEPTEDTNSEPTTCPNKRGLLVASALLSIIVAAVAHKLLRSDEEDSESEDDNSGPIDVPIGE